MFVAFDYLGRDIVFLTCFSLIQVINLLIFLKSRRPEVFCKKGVLRNFAKFTGKHLYQSLFFDKVTEACNFIKIETQVFSCDSGGTGVFL